VPQPTFFETPAHFRAWLEEHHDVEEELWVGYYKKGTDLPSITWPESVDEALCFGWIDGLRKSVDEVSYKIRFTPRKPTSNWSAVNVARIEALTEEGRMQPAGLAAWERRKQAKTAVYSYEQRKKARFPEEFEAEFQAHEKAWAFFQSQPPGYRSNATFWVISAKREDTRRRRLATLIEDSAAGRKIAPLRRP
jgi:uncharacterized protein YdeI (YjbR/CyaY-like superfamily)